MLPYYAKHTIYHPGTDAILIEQGEAFGPTYAVFLLASGVLLSNIAAKPGASTSASLVLLALANYYRQ